MQEIEIPESKFLDVEQMVVQDFAQVVVKFDDWLILKSQIRAHNEAIRNGVVVYSPDSADVYQTWDELGCNDPRPEAKRSIYKAFLINRQPIKPKSREEQLEEVLREFVRKFHPDDFTGVDKVVFEMYEKAKALLEQAKPTD